MKRKQFSKYVMLFSTLNLIVPTVSMAMDNEPTELLKNVDSSGKENSSRDNSTDKKAEQSNGDNNSTSNQKDTQSSSTTSTSENSDKKEKSQNRSSSLDWEYEDYGDRYLIVGYKGNDTDLVIPNEINGVPTMFNSFLFNPDIGKQNITSLSFSTEGGRKVVFTANGLSANSLRLSDYTNLQSFDGRGLDLSTSEGLGTTDISYVFQGLKNLKSVDISNWNNLTNMDYLFSDCTNLTNVQLPTNTSNVDKMSRLFNNCQSLENVDVSHFDTSKVKDMAYMFAGCIKLKAIDLSHFNTQNVTNMQNMFGKCLSLSKLDVSNFDTRNVTNMAYMFNQVKVDSIDVDEFDTSKVTNMTYMFNGCSNLSSLDVSHFNTSNVTNMQNMFGGTTIPILDLSSFDASRANVDNMFFSNSPQFFFVLTNDDKLKKYDYLGSNRLVGGPQFNANGGNFSNGQSTKTYFDSCAISPNDPKLQLKTFEQFKEDLKPTKSDSLFKGWNLTEGNEPKSDSDLFKLVKYTANWTGSLENGYIPSQDVDNIKPPVSSSYGIAYMPKSIAFPKADLSNDGTQFIPMKQSSNYHVAVRDQRMMQNGWTLQAQLVWDKDQLPGSYIQTTNEAGTVKKNINDGSHPFQPSDLVENDGTVSGEKDVKIGSTLTTIMTGNGSEHNGVYDYNLGNLSLVLENVQNIQPGQYTGNINWNLTSAPQ